MGVREAVVTGPVTVLFTDVERSTELHTRLGDDAAREILRTQERLVRHHVEAHGGREVKALGDGFMVAFASTRAALACAVAIQRDLDSQTSPPAGVPVRVRMGLNAGEVTEERQDLFGAAVAAAARIAAQADGGEILIADVVRQLAGVVPGLRFFDRGPVDLKGFPDPVHLHEVLWREETAQFAFLGPLEVSIAGRPVNLGGSTPRTLLAMLLLRLGEVVATDALIEGLWGDRVPPSAINSLHSHLSRLRRVLGGGREAGAGFRVVRHGAGYVLEGDPERVDARRFERLVEDGRRALAAGDTASAAGLLRQALGLWRGPALADFPDAAFVQAEAVRLDELRLAVTEELVDVELGLGNHAALVPQLEALVAAHPLRERFWGQLMVSLYRAGRQADALRAYQRVRDVLVDELGIEPGPTLRHLEDQILRQAPELEAPDGAGRPSLVPPAAATPMAPALPAPVTRDAFVGREGELARLDEALAEAIGGEGRLVLVEGEAGLGKTALVERFAARARAGGAAVCFGRAWEDEGAPPFWPWVEAVRARLEQSGEPGDPTAVDLVQLLPEAAAPADSAAAVDP
ncbi:MAG: AAA family ATPase, partial [Actinomycetota bacterium]|nr:AAA family ATPase [Actinomycetota bacterium]